MPRKVVPDQPEDVSWRPVHRYVYIERPFEDTWPLLAKAPGKRLIKGAAGRYHGSSELHAHLAGMDVSRTVKVRFGGVVCDDEVARLALRWQDANHPRLFPVLEGVIELAPLSYKGRHLTQVGLIGRYRPPLGRVGTLADTAAGGGVAADSVESFLQDLATRLEALVEAAPADEGAEDGQTDASLRHVLVPVEGLRTRPGGAVAVVRHLVATPGVMHAEVDAVVGLAEIRYDPAQCDFRQLVADLEDEAA